MAREISKDITMELDGEEKILRIKKMDAFSGTALLKFLLEKCMPVVQKAINALDAAKSGKTEEGNETADLERIAFVVPELLSTVTEEDLKKLMVQCLQTVECDMPAGWTNVVSRKGNFQIPALEYDIGKCLILCYEVIVYNCSGFFGENGLTSLLASKVGAQ